VATIQENARLTARSALLEATLDHMNLGLMIVDAAGRTFCHEPACRRRVSIWK
jgi:hypothetical protein